MSIEFELDDVDSLAEAAWSAYEPQKPANMPPESAERFRRDLRERPELAIGVLLPTPETFAAGWPGVKVKSSSDSVERLD